MLEGSREVSELGQVLVCSRARSSLGWLCRKCGSLWGKGERECRVTWVRTGNRLPEGRRGVGFYVSPVWGQACPLARREKFGGLGFEFRDLINTQFPQATDKVFMIILFNTCNLTAAITNKKLYVISVVKQKRKDPKPCDFVLVIYIWHRKFPTCVTFPRRL